MAYKDHARSTRGPDGIYMLKPTCPKEYWGAGWKGVNEFRPFPCPDGGGGFLPARLSTAPYDFSDFITKAETVIYTGQHRKLSFITEWPGMSDAEESPMMRFYRSIQKAWDSGAYPQWKEYVYGRNAHIQKPGISVFMQGCLKMHNGKKVDKTNVVFMIKQSGRWALEKLLSEPNEDYKHPGDSSSVDLAKYFKYPDPTDLQNGGCIVATPQESTQERKAHYAIGLGTAMAITPEQVNKEWMPWDEVLRYMEPGEQFKLLETAYPREMLAYAFQGTDLLPKDFMVSAPQAQVQPQMQPQMQQQPAGNYGQAAPQPQQPQQMVQPQTVQTQTAPPAGQPQFAQPPQSVGQPADPTQPPQGAASQGDPQSGVFPGYPGTETPGQPAAQPTADPSLGFAPSESAEPQPPQTAEPTYTQAAAQASQLSPEAAKAQEELDRMNAQFKKG